MSFSSRSARIGWFLFYRPCGEPQGTVAGGPQWKKRGIEERGGDKIALQWTKEEGRKMGNKIARTMDEGGKS